MDRSTHLDYTAARAKIARLGMDVDEAALAYADRLFVEEKVSERAANRLVEYHALLVQHYFTPSTHGRLARIKLALHFLFR